MGKYYILLRSSRPRHRPKIQAVRAREVLRNLHKSRSKGGNEAPTKYLSALERGLTEHRKNPIGRRERIAFPSNGCPVRRRQIPFASTKRHSRSHGARSKAHPHPFECEAKMAKLAELGNSAMGDSMGGSPLVRQRRKVGRLTYFSVFPPCGRTPPRTPWIGWGFLGNRKW